MIDYSKYLHSNKSDEKYTPQYAVLPIIKYLPRKAVIWCPLRNNMSSRVMAWVKCPLPSPCTINRNFMMLLLWI